MPGKLRPRREHRMPLGAHGGPPPPPPPGGWGDTATAKGSFGAGAGVFEPKTWLRGAFGSGDMVQYVTVLNVDNDRKKPVRLYWSMSDVTDVNAARWEVSTGPFQKKKASKKAGKSFVAQIVATGLTLIVPTAGQYAAIDIDVAKFLPDKPNGHSYYVRLFPYLKGVEGKPSNTVRITDDKDTGWGLDLSRMPSESGLFVNLWLQRFYLEHGPTEASGDEPYVIAIAVFFDGTTVNVTRPNDASVRVWMSPPDHDNILKGGPPLTIQNSVRDISSNGLAMSAHMLPIPNLDGGKGGEFAQVILVVLAFERDETSDQTYNTIRDAIEKQLKAALDTTVKEQLQAANVAKIITGQTPPPDVSSLVIKQLSDNLPNEIFSRIGDFVGNIGGVIAFGPIDVLNPATIGTLIEATNLDDIIGMDKAQWSFSALREKALKNDFFSIDLTFPGPSDVTEKNSLRYRITGTLTPIPSFD